MGTKKTSAVIPQQALHNIMHYLLLQQINNSRLFLQNPQPRHPHYLFQYYKNFRLTKRLRDTALSLLKTQYTKFPVDHGAG
jgi:hypothetical protein